MTPDDDGFRHFAEDLATAIGRYEQGKLTESELLEKQCQQFKRLTDLEEKFRLTLVNSSLGLWVYDAFLELICETNGNILTSRPFFRERNKVCNGPINAALKLKHSQSMYQYHINYNFVSFVMSCRTWGKTNPLRLLARQIEALRREIVELNMPLAISQARIFWQKAPTKMQDKRFTFMDFVQAAGDGLLSAVDKFVLPPGLDKNAALIRVWRAVAIGRMRGNFIAQFSETTLHFWPPDRQKLYHANKNLRDCGPVVDYEILASKVNATLGAGVTNAEELASLMSAATSTMIRGGEDPDDDNETPLDRAAAGADWQPDVQAEHREMAERVRTSIMELTPLEQKLISLRGVDLNAI